MSGTDEGPILPRSTNKPRVGMGRSLEDDLYPAVVPNKRRTQRLEVPEPINTSHRKDRTLFYQKQIRQLYRNTAIHLV